MKALLPDGTVIFSKIVAVTTVNAEYIAREMRPHHFYVLLENCNESLQIGGADYDEIVRMRDKVLQIADTMSDQGWVA